MGFFLMGASFSIALCPTMFVLFFVALMPVVLAYSYGLILLIVFGIVSSIPVLHVIGSISSLGLSGSLLKKSLAAGLWVQRIAGLALLLVGIFDIAT